MGQKERIGQVADYLRGLQNSIVAAASGHEPAGFRSRLWRSRLGRGEGRLVEGGGVLERAGVSLSRVAADSLPAAATARNPQLAGRGYEAVGVSLVFHPRNPFAPTVHMNVRYFSAGEDVWWFGGGADLTPHYGFAEDCIHFHAACRDALDRIDAGLHPRFKAQCDEYFLIRHRGERRGVGGVFFDDHSEGGFERAFAVMRAVGDCFIPAYMPILGRRKGMPYGEAQRAHQLHRRGRYVEFNLIYDRGTLFGLQSGGLADAILMSMPPQAAWDSTAPARDPADDERLAAEFLEPRDWAAQAEG